MPRMQALAVAGVLSFLFSSAPGRADTIPALGAGPHDIDLGEVRLHYVVEGTGPVVLVTSPGWGIGSLYLQSSLRPLESSHTFVFVDTRGSGGSSRPADPRRMSQGVMADDLDQLRARLGLDGIDLFGHSDGGTIALEYAERHGEHLHRLVVVDGRVLGDRQADADTAAILELWSNDPHYRDAVAAYRTPPPENEMTDSEAGQFLESISPLYLSDPQRLLPTLHALLGSSPVAAFAFAAEDSAEAVEKRDQLKDAKAVTARTLIISGTVDFIVSCQSAQRLHDAMPSSRLSLYANKGHLPWLEDPDRFFREVDDFLKAG